MRHKRVLGVAGGLGVVEVTLVIGLQAHREFVEVFGDLVIVVEALDVVDGFVAVMVVEFGELVTASDVNFIVDDFEPEGLEESGADSFPGKTSFELIDAFHDPDVAHPGADGGAFAIRVEVKAAGAHPRLMRVEVLNRNGKGVDGEGAGFVAPFDFCGNDSGRIFWCVFQVGLGNLRVTHSGFTRYPIDVDGIDLRFLARGEIEAKGAIFDGESFMILRNIFKIRVQSHLELG